MDERNDPLRDEINNLSNDITFYECTNCGWSGNKNKFIQKVISIMYRPKYQNIQSFVNFKCPKCQYIVNIAFEKMEA